MKKDFSNAQKIVKKLIETKQTISCAESFTGGLISHCISQIPNASQCFYGGIVSYSNQAKNTLLFVPNLAIEKFDAVSKEVLELMLDGALKQFHTDFALASTGFAGPDGKDVGKIFLGIKHKNGEKKIMEYHLNGDRKQIQTQGCMLILQEFLLYLNFFSKTS
ncbi:CinA family protein [Helicobacter sp. faydin-H20]|uniref:CinA family protein n=1 Tax=Helicobacter anatolicus TaxID=2905874 RepID=UPI001E622AEB|nr:CinA family protein [Helicobacter anatolicus]MCE3037452.1 CinA family protein [Helicobacter anatolicus]